ncbi:MAG: invasion associated locus B family protein [Beijerinckiaceae bacterium]|nr:invasion associated locus B family protein [Beijerinckiaceae bacterium]
MQNISRRYGAAALGLCLAFASAESFAQTPRPTQKPAAQAPAAQPPAAGANRVELKPSQPEWTKVCGKDPQAGKEICYTTRDFGQAADQPPVLAVAVYDVKGDAQRIVRLLLPVGLLLRPGFRFSIDKGAALEGTYEICFPNGCFAESRLDAKQLEVMKRGSALNINVKNQANAEVVFAVPLEGFGKAFDGPAVDPKVLEEQQQALQAELQKRAEEERRRLEGTGAAPSAPAAPAAPAAPR